MNYKDELRCEVAKASKFAEAIVSAKEAVEVNILRALEEEFGKKLAADVEFQLRVKELR